jgi:hypothetical protein
MLNYVKFALLSSKMVTWNLCYILVKYYAGMIMILEAYLSQHFTSTSTFYAKVTTNPLSVHPLVPLVHYRSGEQVWLQTE